LLLSIYLLELNEVYVYILTDAIRIKHLRN
jgi:hypothetical protein